MYRRDERERVRMREKKKRQQQGREREMQRERDCKMDGEREINKIQFQTIFAKWCRAAGSDANFANSNKDDSSDRYREFLMAHRQFSFLRQLRWAHQRADEDLKEGSLAIECPACPQPLMNMDPNWREGSAVVM